MNKNTMTKQDIIASAAAVACDAAEGRLDPAALEAEVTTACRELVGTVVGEGDPLWPLQVGIARGVLAAHGLPAAELRESAAVQQRFEDTEANDAR